MDYRELTYVYDELSATTKRLVKTHIISKFIAALSEDEIEQSILLLQGRLYPIWDEHKLGVSTRVVIKAIAKASGASIGKIEDEWKRLGDLGDVAKEVLSNKASTTLDSFGAGSKEKLTVKRVFESLRKLASLGGERSIDMKVNIIVDLLASAQGNERIYLIRTILEDLRVGVAEGIIRDAIAWAYFSDKMRYIIKEEKIEVEDRKHYNSYIDMIQHAYDLSNDFSVVCKAIKNMGEEGLKRINIKVGRPIKVMLALKAQDIEDGFNRVGKPCQLEYKYDGFRTQVHKAGDVVRLFTRRFEDVTGQFPDVVEYVKNNVNAKNCILDCETVGYDKATGKYLPFQQISQRIRRKYRIDEMAEFFPVELNVFDILFYEDKSTITLPLKKRREIIESIIKIDKRKIVVAISMVSSDASEAEAFYSESLESGNEGIMIKKLDAPYKPGARVGFMLKMKPTMDPLDLVIVGAEWGEGKRASWLSSFTLACIDDEDEFREIGKLGTGIKEKIGEGTSFEELTALLRPLIISETGREIKLKPEIVVEVTFQEIQRSPSYSSGYALRFPALKALRPDRKPEDISTLNQVEDLYYNQKT